MAGFTIVSLSTVSEIAGDCFLVFQVQPPRPHYKETMERRKTTKNRYRLIRALDDSEQIPVNVNFSFQLKIQF